MMDGQHGITYLIIFAAGFSFNAYIFGMYRWLWLQSEGDRDLYLRLLDALTPNWASGVKIVSYISIYLSIILFALSEDYLISIGLLLFQWIAPMFIPYNFRIYKPIYQKIGKIENYLGSICHLLSL